MAAAGMMADTAGARVGVLTGPDVVDVEAGAVGVSGGAGRDGMGSVYAREQHGEDLRGLEQYEVVLSLERAVDKSET